jgi:hypothetical protein
LLSTLCCGANSVPAINLQGTKTPEQRLVFFSSSLLPHIEELGRVTMAFGKN